MEYPKNQKEFELLVNNSERCYRYIYDIKYVNGFLCSKCDSTNFWLISHRVIRCKNCKKEISLTAGTIFHSSNLELPDLFRVIWWMVAQKNGISAKGLERILDIGYPTAWVWLQKFRRVMVVSAREKLSGDVEVDEMFVGGKQKGKRGRGAEGKKLVAIAVEVLSKGTGRTRLSVISDASRKSLNEFLRSNIERGSIITTDAWSGYTDVTKMKYSHKIINQTKEIDKQNLLPNVHRIAALVKRWLLGTHQSYVNKGLLEFYLDEFTFRYNRRKSKSRGLLFHTIVYQAMHNEPLLNKKLMKKQT